MIGRPVSIINYGLMSTHPPTECGLATFNSALSGHLAAVTGGQVGIVQVASGGEPAATGPEVVHTWSAKAEDGWDGAASALNTFDVAIIQHEYGIYPGPDGEDVLRVLARLTVPCMVVLHTVLATPTVRQKAILEQIVSLADAVVTMTGTARDRLLVGYDIDGGKVMVIAHGANDHRRAAAIVPRRRPHLLTWGLLGPGKGLEWALRALARLGVSEQQPTYTIAGKTHPKVLADQGDVYRDSLEDLVDLLGVRAQVTFDPRYRDNASLSRLISSADVVVLPYDSTEQVTSGVLIEAVAAKVPVVATAFPHAVEVLGDGRGLVVPHRDASALAAAIRRVLTEPGLSGRLASRSGDLSVAPPWPSVARRYAALAAELTAARRALALL